VTLCMSDFSRLDDLILEAIRKLKEPSGSSKLHTLRFVDINLWSAHLLYFV
jgi:hypothetical protein